MIRSIYLFALIALLALGAVWLADNPGAVTLRWDNYVVETTVVVLVLATALLALSLLILLQIFFWLKSRPGKLGGAFSARRRGKGLEAISNGMVAIAAGDAEEARKAAVAAEKHLKGEPLTLLLAAQAAELNDDDRAAQIYYDRMTERKDTEFLGLRGLIARAKAENNLQLAIEQTLKADSLKPGTEWVQKELLELYLTARDYVSAEGVLSRMARGKAAKSDKVKRLKAVIAYQLALEKEQAGEKDAAAGYAQKAHDLAPDFVPASVLAIRHSVPGRKQDRLLNEAWRHAPHPELADAIQALVPGESPKDWYLRAKRLIAPLKPESRETLLVMGKAALATQEWGEARQYLSKAAEVDPSSSVYRLLADLEETANADAAAARNWIIKSAEAPQDPLWICASCGRQERNWTAHCPTCETFDSQSWRKVDRAEEEPDVISAEIVKEIEAPAVE